MMTRLIKQYKTNFTFFNNDIFKDKRLSYKELGLLCQMMSLPDYWEFSVRGLASLHSDGKNGVAKTLNKLIDYGYIWRDTDEQGRTKEGRFSKLDYFIYDDPNNNPHYTNLSPKRDTDKRDTEKGTISNTNKLNTKEYISINNNKNKTTTVIDKHGNFVVEKENKTSKGFNQDRIIQANAIQIARINEAERNDISSKEAIKYLTDSCNCFGIKQIEKINNLPDEDFEYLFNIAHDIVTCEGDSGLYNPKGYLSSQITRCIKAHT